MSVRVLNTGVVELVQDRAGDGLALAFPGDGEFGLSEVAGVGRPHAHLVELAANGFGGVPVDVDDVDLSFGSEIV